MPSLRKRKNGIYEKRFYYQNKCYSVYSKNLNKLKIKEKEKIKQLKNSNNNIKNDITIKDWSHYWLENFKKPFVKEKTYFEIKNYINKHIIDKLGNLSLNKITTNQLQTFLNNYEKSRTKELIYLYLNAILKKAFEIGMIKNNPLNAVIKDKKIKSNKQAFTLEEQKTIINKLSQPLKNVILIYLLTGIRKNEINMIKEIGVNFIKVVREKTENKTKTISLTHETIELIKNTIKNKINTDKISKLFSKFLKENNINNKSLHTTRHTYATNNYYLETPIKHLQEFLGHEDVQTTLNIYTNVDNSITKNEIIKLYNNYYYIVKN